MNLLVTRDVHAVSGEDDHRDCLAETTADIRQQIEAGILAQRDIEHHEVDAIGRERAACAFGTIHRYDFGYRPQFMSDKREDIVVVIDMKDARTWPDLF